MWCYRTLRIGQSWACWSVGHHKYSQAIHDALPSYQSRVTLGTQHIWNLYVSASVCVCICLWMSSLSCIALKGNVFVRIIGYIYIYTKYIFMTNPKSDMVHSGLNQSSSRQKNGNMSFSQHPKIYSSWSYSLSIVLLPSSWLHAFGGGSSWSPTLGPLLQVGFQ